MIDAVVKAYKDANAFLVGKDVMPEIDLKSFVRRTGSVSSGPGALGGSFAGSYAGSAPMGMTGQQSQPVRGGFGVPPGSFAPAAIGVGMGRGASAQGLAGGDTMLVTGGSPLLLARQRAQGVLLNLKRFVTARIGGDISQQRLAAGGEMMGGGVIGAVGGGFGGGGGGGGHRPSRRPSPMRRRPTRSRPRSMSSAIRPPPFTTRRTNCGGAAPSSRRRRQRRRTRRPWRSWR